MLFQQDNYLACKIRYPDGRRTCSLNLFNVIHITRQFKINILLIFALLSLFNHAVIADEGVLKLTAGAEYISGDFGGTQSIDELYIPFTARYFVDRYVFRLTVPFVRVTAPTDTILADGTFLTGAGERITETGLGDVIAGMTYLDALSSEASSDVALDLTLKVKFGTADVNKGLGTGENDYTFQAELYKYYERLMTFGILGYKFRGDPPGVDLSDSLLAFFGGTYRLSPSLDAGLDYYFQEALFSDMDDQKELTVSLGYSLSKTQYLRGYLLQGFGNASPDVGVGVMLTIRQ